MKEKILSFLKTNTKLQGVPENYLLGVAEHYSKTVTEETQIATTFTDGVIDLLKLNANLLQSEGDKRATEASKTALKNFQKEHGLNEDGTPIKPVKPVKTKEKEVETTDEPVIPEWAKKIQNENAELKTKLETQEQEKTSAALTDKVLKHEKLKGIPASWLKGRNLIPKSEGEIDQLAETLEADYNGFKQELVEQGVIMSVPPASTGSAKEGEAIGKTIAEKRNANASDGVKGKEV